MTQLSPERTYTRNELRSCLLNRGESISNNTFSWLLQKELAAERLQHVGRDAYRLPGERRKKTYAYTLSKPAETILELVSQAFPLVDVQIWETRQYNEFLNHQIGMNTIFLEVEKPAIDAIYEVLAERVQKHVLVQPNLGDFLRYQNENTVVLLRRTSQSPAMKNAPGMPALEKLLVDLKANKYLQTIVNPAEIEDIFTQAFAQYSVSTGTLRRYAQRRTAWEKVAGFLPEQPTSPKPIGE